MSPRNLTPLPVTHVCGFVRKLPPRKTWVDIVVMNLKKFLGSPEIGAVHTKLTILDVFEGVMGRCFSDFFLLALNVDCLVILF